MRKSFAKIYQTPFRFPSESHFFTKREYLSSESVDFEGRSVQSSVFKVDDPLTRYSGLTANDFCLENQLAVGVAQNPVRCNLVNSNEEDNNIK